MTLLLKILQEPETGFWKAAQPMLQILGQRILATGYDYAKSLRVAIGAVAEILCPHALQRLENVRCEGGGVMI